MKVMRQGGSGDAHFLLKSSNRQARIPGPDERPIHLEPGRIAQGLQLLCCLFEFHGNTSKRDRQSRYPYFEDNRNVPTN